MEPLLEPIEHKIRFWIEYEKNLPQIPFKGNEIFFDEYRSRYDLDCQFLGGDLSADTIFSLWLPLQYALQRCNDEEQIAQTMGPIRKRQLFLQKLLNQGLEQFLPPELPVVQRLSHLFLLGQGRENVMRLSNRGLNLMRGQSPYDDYMPYFLVECFKGGKFAHIFNQDEGLLRFWLMREELQGFFEDEFLVAEAVLDLSGTDDVRNGVPPRSQDTEEDQGFLTEMLDQYITILEERREKLIQSQ